MSSAADFTSLTSLLTLATSILLAVAGLLQAIAAVAKAARAVEGEVAQPLAGGWSLARISLLLISVILPVGVLAWWILYAAGLNATRLGEPLAFFLLTAELALPVALYALGWRLWLYPRLVRRQAVVQPHTPAR